MSMFTIGLSGLNAAQNALNTTSNNISNVYTPGYNRELTILTEGNTSGGVKVSDIQRQFDRYVADQLNDATSTSSALETYQTQVSQIDNLLADDGAGLSPLMQDFFSAMSDLSGSPSDPAARQGVLGSADTLSAQVRSFDAYLQDMQTGINAKIGDEVTQINNTSKQLASLNREIVLAEAKTGEAPNSLLNQRDKLVNDLSERLNIKLNIQDGGTYNVTLSNGQPLVAGTNNFQLEAISSNADPQRTVVGYQDSGGNMVELNENRITGGSLGGLLNFRSETLDKTQNQIGQLAVSLVSGFNEQHAAGIDLDGDVGGSFFSIGSPRAYAHSDNEGTADVASTTFGDTSNLLATDYEIRVENGTPTAAEDFTITRKDSGAELAAGSDFTFNGSDELTFGGVAITFDSGSLQQGDRFEVQPVRRAGRDMQTEISDLDKIAAGSILNGDTEAVASIKGEPGNALASGNAPWSLSISDAGGGSFDIVATPDTGASQNFSVQPGDEITLDGVALTFGNLADGQTLSLGLNGAGTGDNRNAIALQDLQGSELVTGSATLNESYASMVSDVGNRTNIVQVNLEAQNGLTEQLRGVQQSESGVNLDEEAANLIRYQQYYQANSKVIQTASTVFDTILGLRT
ncbi:MULTISPECIES: flagellar hook-associated protein FlgK [Halomonadaceae]|uniref:flagellar hook-associated protein FlgK n=1 Tax=Halomonadaceae TaxID=28256 RepID=UPI0015819987|nr:MULTISPECIES: flagellar hook-associated protein FlgK [Halomonas]MDI4637820.1 flagellar hook-associated protein FlgK [Halomonas sp. BMC7]NUJ58842.1 flagellar hook-associated protein FlgK [Halomonas taeanensis]